jgi:hypothetical protein
MLRYHPLFLFAALFAACDYAPAERVDALSKDVETVRTEQRVMAAQVESTVREQSVIQASVSAMGAGFNVISESMVDQGERVTTLETTSQRLQRDVSSIRNTPAPLAPRPRPQAASSTMGVRTDLKTLEETAMQVQWCEGPEGSEGYLRILGEETIPDRRQCWQFGEVAIFRHETTAGPVVRCLRDITIENGRLKALDCESQKMYSFHAR